MVPLVVAAIFQGFYFVFNYFVSVIDRMEEQHKLNVIAERKLEEKLVNENLKEIFKNLINNLHYNTSCAGFVIKINKDNLLPGAKFHFRRLHKELLFRYL